ncbi:MAG: hypothetical protein CMQ69_07425 [Gammaproteobacteria bacterium]|nr:hypothetical protein [Gammaproteobacteria bacterium]
MDEAQRIAYLKHMGVEQYYPRYVLVGAKASVIPAAAQDIYNPQGSQQLPAKTRQAEPPRSELDATKPGFDASRRQREIAAEEVATRHQRQVRPAEAETGRAEIGKEQIPGEALRFSVQFFWVNARLAVINEAPHEAGGRENQQATSLLTNLLVALGLGQEELAGLTAGRFNWPIAEGLGAIGDSRHAARMALKGFITQRHEQQGFSNLLLLTAQLVDVMSDHSERPYMGDQKRVDAPYEFTITHSLNAMLAHSDLKREAWQHLAALRGRLQSV